MVREPVDMRVTRYKSLSEDPHTGEAVLVAVGFLPVNYDQGELIHYGNADA